MPTYVVRLTSLPFNAAALLRWRGVVSAIFLASLVLGAEWMIRLDREGLDQEQRATITARVADIRARLETELDSTLFLTSGMVAYASEIGGELDETRADALLSAIYRSGRNIRNIAIAPDNRVRWVYPRAGNERAVGLYYPDSPRQWPTIREAMQTRRTVVAGPVPLVQGGFGVVARAPVFLPDGEYWGLLSMVVDWEALIRSARLDEPIAGLRFAIRGRDGKGESGEVFYGDPGIFARDPVKQRIELPGGQWVIGAEAMPGEDVAPRHLNAKRVGYYLLALAMAALMYAVLREAQTRLQHNQELAKLNASLEDRVAVRTAELTQANAQLTEALGTLRRAQDSLVQSEKLAALGGMVAGVAHELNTPIGNSLLASSSLHDRIRGLRQPQEPLRRSQWERALDEMEEACTIVQRSLTRAADLVSSFKQVAANRSNDQRRRFRLDTTVRELGLTLRPSLRRAQLELGLAIDSDVEMDSYPGPLDQVLINLIQNAIVHAYPDGGPGVVQISAHREDEQVVIVCTDLGVGISADHLPRVFDPFFTTRLGRGGTGLGLNIVHNIVTGVLGGRIEVDSQPGRGTRFTVHLPLRAPGDVPATST